MTNNVDDFDKEKKDYITKLADNIDYNKATHQQVEIPTLLKAKAYLKNSKKIVDVTAISLEKCGIYYNLDNFNTNMFCDFNHCVIMQNIGIKDKTGKDIYTNHIVNVVYKERRKYQDMEYDSRWECTELVAYNCKACAFVFQTYIDDINLYRYIDDFRMDSRNIKIESVEIIGNIFENPELLEDDDL